MIIYLGTRERTLIREVFLREMKEGTYYYELNKQGRRKLFLYVKRSTHIYFMCE
jgi:hypothetical protein